MLQKKLYKCLDCYEDGVEDCIMCYQCKQEHIEANEGNKTRFEVIEKEQEL